MASARRVLIVDDERDIRTTLRAVFGSAGYECRMAGNGRGGGRSSSRPSAPRSPSPTSRCRSWTGSSSSSTLKARDADAAVIMLTGAADVRTAVESLKHGASDFILKPVNLDQVLLSAERALERRQLLIERREHQALLEHRVAEATRDLAAALGELQQTYQTTLEALGSVLATREIGTELHSRRVHAYSLALARAHGLPAAELDALGRGVLLHDIGKIGISDAILLKPGPLTPEEWAIMRSHPEIGRQILESIPFLRDAIPVVHHHHERWDGTGYPLGLAGRGHPPGRPHLRGRRRLRRHDLRPALLEGHLAGGGARSRSGDSAGTHFDPDVVATLPAHAARDLRGSRAPAVDRPGPLGAPAGSTSRPRRPSA